MAAYDTADKCDVKRFVSTLHIDFRQTKRVVGTFPRNVDSTGSIYTTLICAALAYVVKYFHTVITAFYSRSLRISCIKLLHCSGAIDDGFLNHSPSLIHSISLNAMSLMITPLLVAKDFHQYQCVYMLLRPSRATMFWRNWIPAFTACHTREKQKNVIFPSFGKQHNNGQRLSLLPAVI